MLPELQVTHMGPTALFNLRVLDYFPRIISTRLGGALKMANSISPCLGLTLEIYYLFHKERAQGFISKILTTPLPTRRLNGGPLEM